MCPVTIAWGAIGPVIGRLRAGPGGRPRSLGLARDGAGDVRTAPAPLVRLVRRPPSAAPVPPPPSGRPGRPPRSAGAPARPHAQAAGGCSAVPGRLRPAAGGAARGRAHRGQVQPGPRPQRRRPPPAGPRDRRASAGTPGPAPATATRYRDTDCHPYIGPPFCDHRERNKQIPLSLRRNPLPGKLINRALLISHQHLARTLVQLLETAKTSSCSNAVLHHAPEAFDRIKVVATMGW